MDKFAIPRKNVVMIIAGLAVIVLGYFLMAGGGSNDPAVFSEKIFSVTRLTVSPLLIVAGFVIIVVAIMKRK